MCFTTSARLWATSVSLANYKGLRDFLLMPQPFVYNALPSRVIFGTGTIGQVAREVASLKCSRALVLTIPQQVEQGQAMQELLGVICVGLYTNATMHMPTDVTEDAMCTAKKLRADCVIAVGGGSTIGLGKAIALRTDLPQIVIPMTYAGSEVYIPSPLFLCQRISA